MTDALQRKCAKQRDEIARLTQKLEAAAEENARLRAGLREVTRICTAQQDGKLYTHDYEGGELALDDVWKVAMDALESKGHE
jgi:hypothetical protein